MTQLLENIFAVEVPEDVHDCKLSRDNPDEPTYISYKRLSTGEYRDGFDLENAVQPEFYEILFTTKDCTEIQAAIVVEQQKGGGRYKDYLVDGSLTKTGTYLIYGAKNSLHSLLVSHDLNLSKNYLLLKKIS